MIDWIFNAKLTNLAGVLLYWVFVLICLTGYSYKTYLAFKKDLARRALESSGDMKKFDFYTPKLTYGKVLGRIFVAFVPVVNIWCAVFDISVLRIAFSTVFSMLAKPVVPRHKDTEQ